MIYDALILGGGVAGMSAALIFGSAMSKPFMTNKRVGIIIHQKSSSLQNAVFNNTLGLPIGKLGSEILEEGKKQLAQLYPEVDQIEKEMIMDVTYIDENLIKVTTNKNEYITQKVVVCTGSKRMAMPGLEKYKALHPKLPIAKERIMLENTNYLVDKGIYVAGTLAGERSQFAIAAGSGTTVATDILTEWNNDQSTMIHDKL